MHLPLVSPKLALSRKLFCWGLVFTDGETWREHRRFTLSCLRDFGLGKKPIELKIQEEAEFFIQVCHHHYGQPPLTSHQDIKFQCRKSRISAEKRSTQLRWCQRLSATLSLRWSTAHVSNTTTRFFKVSDRCMNGGYSPSARVLQMVNYTYDGCSVVTVVSVLTELVVVLQRSLTLSIRVCACRACSTSSSSFPSSKYFRQSFRATSSWWRTSRCATTMPLTSWKNTARPVTSLPLATTLTPTSPWWSRRRANKKQPLPAVRHVSLLFLPKITQCSVTIFITKNFIYPSFRFCLLSTFSFWWIECEMKEVLFVFIRSASASLHSRSVHRRNRNGHHHPQVDAPLHGRPHRCPVTCPRRTWSRDWKISTTQCEGQIALAVHRSNTDGMPTERQHRAV